MIYDLITIFSPVCTAMEQRAFYFLLVQCYELSYNYEIRLNYATAKIKGKKEGKKDD